MPHPTEETFDILTPDGRPTGERKTRSAVHRDGDWHRSFHLWVGWRDPDGEPRVLFQQRAPDKDTWPNRLDVAVGGHFSSGESLEQVFREVHEELGFHPPRAECLPVGTRYVEYLTPGWLDREIQEVFIYPSDDIPDLRPDPIEISALYVLSPADVERLAEGADASVPARRATVGPGRRLSPWEPTSVRLDDFVPASDGYVGAGARLVAEALAGRTQLSLRLQPGISKR